MPPVLLTGDHKKIDEWRGAQSRERTRERRPDLYDAWCESHPLTELPKWKRGENMRLVKNDEQLALCAPSWLRAAAQFVRRSAARNILQK